MKIKNILMILFFAVLSRSVLATTFTVFNLNRLPMECNLVWGAKAQGLHRLDRPTYKERSAFSGVFDVTPAFYSDNTYLHTLRGIWWRTITSDFEFNKKNIYFADLNNVLGAGKAIPVYQLGVKITPMHKEVYDVNGRKELKAIVEIEFGGNKYEVPCVRVQYDPNIFSE